MNQQQIKDKLLLLDETTEDFSVILSGKKSKKVDGLYHPESREIIIHNKNHENDNRLMYTAIHEFAHHVQFTTSPVPVSSRCHTIRFWSIFHRLLNKAEEIGIHENVFESNNEFRTLTEKIKKEFMSENGRLMKEFGKLLLEAQLLCEKHNTSFSDYLDRVLGIPRTSARAMIRVHAFDISPEMGFENMKIVSGIKDEAERRNAESAFLSGSTPDMVRMQFTSKTAPESPLESLTREKTRIRKQIDSLTYRLNNIEKRIRLIAGDEDHASMEN